MFISLRHRFFLATLGASALAATLFLTVVTVILTPNVARRLVTQDAQIQLLQLAATMPRTDGAIKDAYLRRASAPAWSRVELIARAAPDMENPDMVVVPLEDSTLALALRPQYDLATTLKVANPQPLRIASLLVGFLGFVYLLTWALSRFVTQPLKELQSAVTALANGHRHISVVLPKEEELAELADSFNHMAGRLHVREEELAKASARLEKALENKERIFANTSHELRTPLTVILGYAQMLKDGLKGPVVDEQAHCLSVIERNAKVLLGHVEDLLTLSRLKAGQLPLNLESVDVKDLVDDVVSGLRPLASDQKLEVRWSREGPFAAQLDYQRGCQILTNLLENARKYAPGADITIDLRETTSQIEVLVQDQGPGVSGDFASKLFAEFERGPESTEGTGLGLALARGLARQFGGDLEFVESSIGAAFLWSMPRSPAQNSAEM